VPTVRDVTLGLLRELELTTIFSNPGSTEVPFLVDLPGDFSFVLALHEGSVVGMATGYAIASGRPALALLHTTAGLGNGVSAIATARVNRAPLVVLVGQQDRRHLAQEPFLAGRLAGLAGDYPLAVHQPVRAQDVPGTIRQAFHEAVTGRGPVLVIVPMDDWLAPAPEGHEVFGARTVLRPPAADEASAAALADALAAAASPALVVGARADGAAAWAAVVALAEALGCPVWQEAFGAQAGFPQDHPLFAGHLPAHRARLRSLLAGHDVVLTVGCEVFRQYPYVEGPLVEPGTRLLAVSDDAAEVHRSPVELGVIGHPAAVCERVVAALRSRAGAADGSGSPGSPQFPEPPPPPPAPPLRAGHVLDALARRLAPETVLFEECPSNKPELHQRLRIRRPLGFLTPAMGGLGFTLPAAIGVRMARPDRPVVAVLGDGSSLYAIQGLWSAGRYGAGVLFVVLANGRYAIMDRLAEQASGAGAWPDFAALSVATIARGFGAEAVECETVDEVEAALDDIVPGLAERTTPLVLVAAVEPDETFNP
jgi:benzoylformate decarboxylase